MDTSTLFDLTGRTALVTGGSRGIGLMIARGFLAQGARVYISSRKAEVCDAVAEDLGPNCLSLPMDVSTVDGCRGLAEAYASQENGLDILVNNAGAAWGEAFESFPEGGWDKVMNLNVKSPFFLTQALHAALKQRASAEQPAKVINVASIDGLRLNPWETYSYQASKAAIINLTKRTAARLVEDSYQRHRHRSRCLPLGYEPGGSGPRGQRCDRDPQQAHRARRGHGRRGHLPGRSLRGLRDR